MFQVTEPQALGVLHHLDGSSLKPLERYSAKLKSSSKMLGFGGGSVQIEIPGDKSTVRIGSNQKQDFVVQLPNGTDPAKFLLFKFESSKGKRQLQITKFGTFGVKNSTGMGEIATIVTKYGQSSYKIGPAEQLPSGEYGFATPGSSEVIFLFGVE
jgi:hypothetical protein